MNTCPEWQMGAKLVKDLKVYAYATFWHPSVVLILCCTAQTLLHTYVICFNPSLTACCARRWNACSQSHGGLWLLFRTLCSCPDFSMSSLQVMKSLEDGYRLPPPVDCPSILYELMKSCWSHERTRRPHFQEIRAQLQHFISSPQLLRPVADFDPR